MPERIPIWQRHKSVFKVWINISTTLHHRMDRWFYRTSMQFAKRPLLTMTMFLTLCLALLAFFSWIKVETRTYKLYYPDHSRTEQEFLITEKHFQIRTRLAEFIVEPINGGNVLEMDYLRFVSKIDFYIRNNTNIEDVCIKSELAPYKCLTVTPLEFLQGPNGLDLNNPIIALNNRLKDPRLMSNGRPAMFNAKAVLSNIRNNSKKHVTFSTALRFMYFISFPLDDEDAMDEIMEWEQTYVDYMDSLSTAAKNHSLHLYYQATRSEDDATIVSTFGDAKLIAVTLILIVSLTVFSFTNFRQPQQSYGMLALSGLGLVFVGIAAAFGMGLMLHVPLTSITGVVPFLVLGVAVDDIFIILDFLRRSDRNVNTIERIGTVFSKCGSTITMTTLTDIIAFFISTWTVFPGIKFFCIYAAFSLLLIYTLLMTVFVAVMYFDLERRKSNSTPRSNTSAECSSTTPVQPFSSKIFHHWAKIIIKTRAKVIITVTAITILFGLAYISTKIDREFDFSMAAGDTYVNVFLSARKRLFKTLLDVQLVISPDVDISLKSVQDNITNAVFMATSSKYYKPMEINWLAAFRSWAEQANVDYYGPNFYSSLKQFLQSPHSIMFRKDILFLKDANIADDVTTKLVSRITLFMPLDRNSFFYENALIATRQLQDEVLPKPCYVVHTAFYFFEQFQMIEPMTIRNVIICALCILILTAPFLIHPALIFVVAFGFVVLIVELAGIMAIWNVSLNLVSMVILVVAIGFSVDYSAHVGHAYITSKCTSPDEKVVDALTNIGSSVFLGGFSTLLGVLVLAFAQTRPFLIFFKMLLGIVVIGLINGLVILPVFVLWFCKWTPPQKSNRKKQKCDPSQKTSESLLVDSNNYNVDFPIDEWLISDIPESEV